MRSEQETHLGLEAFQWNQLAQSGQTRKSRKVRREKDEDT